MRRLLAVCCLLFAVAIVMLVIGTAAAQPPTPNVSDELLYPPSTKSIDLATYPAKRWIVQLKDPSLAKYASATKGPRASAQAAGGARKLDASSAQSRSYVSQLKAQQQAFAAGLAQVAPGAQVESSYQVVLNGLAVKMSPEQAAAVRKMPGVRAVTPDMPYQLQMYSTPEQIGAPVLWAMLGGQVHAGEGIKVAVIDSGIYVTRTNTGAYAGNACFDDAGYTAPPGFPKGDTRFTNNKVIVARAYFRPDDPPTAGNDTPLPGPGDTSHGTSTAGDIACDMGTQAPYQGITLTLSGVAPRAYLMNYRVFYPSSSPEDFQNGNAYVVELVHAVEDAVADGADVTSNSWGSSYQNTLAWPDPMVEAMEAATDAGVTNVVAAINSGPDPATIGSPGLSSKVIGVGAVSKNERVTPGVIDVTAPEPVPANLTKIGVGSAGFGPTITGTVGPAPYVPVEKVATNGSPLACSLEGDASPFPEGALTGKIALISRGTCAFSEKVYNAQRGGAIAAIVYNSAAGGDEILTMGPGAHAADVTIPSWFIRRTDGLAMIDFYNAHPGQAEARFTFHSEVVPNVGDVMASFSSRGPTTDKWIKPDVVAPGVSVLSSGYGTGAFPANLLGFGAVSGTSFSTPIVAGAAALLKQLHPDWAPWQIKSALMTTATEDVWLNPTRTQRAGVLDRGSGRIDLTKAGQPGLTFDYPSISFELVHPGVTVTRTTTARSVYTATQTYAVTVDGATPGVTFAVAGPTLSVPAGGTAALRVSATVAPTATTGFYVATVRLTGGAQDAHIPLFAEVVPAATGADVLLVDDDGSGFDPSFPDYSAVYSNTLAALGVSFTYLDMDQESFPSMAELYRYKTVLIFTGDNNSFDTSGFFQSDYDRLLEWMDSGGRLWTTGQNYAEASDYDTDFDSPHLGRSRVYHGYLGLTYITGTVYPGPAPKPSASGLNAMTGLVIDLSPNGDGIDNQTSIEGSVPMTDTDTYMARETTKPFFNPMGIVPSGDLAISFGRSSEPTLDEPALKYRYRSVSMGFGLEGVNDDTGFATKQQVARRALDWLVDQVTITGGQEMSGRVNTALTFTASATSTTGSIVEYRWNFGDNTPVVSSPTGTINHTFTTAGHYMVRVMAVDGLGHSAVAEFSVHITAQQTLDVVARAAGYVDSNNVRASVCGASVIWAGQDTRPAQPRILHGIADFDLSALPANATIVSATLDVTGRATQYLQTQRGVFNARLLSDGPWCSRGYYAVHNAPVEATLQPALTDADLKAGTTNTFTFGAADLARLQSRVGQTASFRLDGRDTSPYGLEIMGWDGLGGPNPPTLRIVYSAP